MRSVYHYREFDIRRASLLSSPRIVLSHEWPQHIAHHGDLRALLRQKPFFETDIKSGKLGSPHLMGLLRTLQPEWWFAAHMHVRFEAVVRHGPPLPSSGSGLETETPAKVENPDEIVIGDSDEDEAPGGTEKEEEKKESAAPVPAPVAPANPDEIMLDDEEEEVEAVRTPATPPKETKFLALDKVLPKRQFLEVFDIDSPSPSSPPILSFDPEWLAISRAFHPWFSTTSMQRAFPPEDEAWAMIVTELEWVKKNLMKGDEAAVLLVEEVQKFEMTAPGPSKESENPPGKFKQPQKYTNPQTKAFCKMLEIEDKINGPGS